MPVKILLILSCLILLCVFRDSSAAQWSVPVSITQGPTDDIHPAFISINSPTDYRTIDWLAFARMSGSGTGICVKKTVEGGDAWSDTVYSITNDLAWNDYPKLAGVYSPLMLVWQRGVENSDICYSINRGAGWSQPAALTSDGAGNRTPFVALYDTTFIAVWEKSGRIVSSKFIAGAWTSPAFVTPEGDTTNALPQAHEYYDVFRRCLIVVWEKTKSPGPSHGIMFSMLGNAGATLPDTIAWIGDNRRPKSLRLCFPEAYFTYESNLNGHWEIYSAMGNFVHDTLRWSKNNISQNSSVDNVDASFTYIGEITTKAIGRYTAGTWRVQSASGDSIAAAGKNAAPQYLTAVSGTTDRNPDISPGLWQLYGGLRVWIVWENNANGHWNLYGSKATIIVGVDEPETRPTVARLDQNFPNPWNPSTTIRYHLPYASFVTLTVYNTLGQQVTLLVNERQQSGSHEATFRGGGLASGVYFYQLLGDGFAATKKLVLLR